MNYESVAAEATIWASNLGLAICIAVVAFWLSNFAKSRIVKIGFAYEELDDTLFYFFGSLAKYTILALSVVFILGRFGVQTTSLVALIGAAGLAIGLALQGTLSHLASGVMLILFRPLKLGDFVEVAGHMGTVKAITLFTTELATLDNIQIIVPNGNVWSSSITNYSVYPTRRADMIFGVSYSSDLKIAESVIRDVIAADERCHKDPEPFVSVTTLGDSSVDFTVRVWCDAGDLFTLKADLTRAVKEQFDAKGIDIPFPTTVVHRIDG